MGFNLIKGHISSLSSFYSSPQPQPIQLGLRLCNNNKLDSGLSLQTAVFLLDINGKLRHSDHLIYSLNPESSCKAVKYQASEATSNYASFWLDLAGLSDEVDRLVITSFIEHQKDSIQSCTVSMCVFDPKTDQEILHYVPEDIQDSDSSLVMAEIFRFGHEWRIRAEGQLYTGGLPVLYATYGG